MPAHQEQTPEDRRFERIEAAHEFLTGIVAGIGVAQTKTEEAQLRTQYALTEAVEHMVREHKFLLTAQVLMADAQTRLTEAQAKSELAQAETQGKLNVLIHMWDNWIVENGGKNGNPAPGPETPPAA